MVNKVVNGFGELTTGKVNKEPMHFVKLLTLSILSILLTLLTLLTIH